MARTEAGAALTVRHRQAQIAVRARALRDFLLLWPLWNGDERSFQRLVAATVPLVTAYHGLSSTLAAGYYDAFRHAEQVDGPATPRLADPVVVDKVVAALYVTGQNMTRKALLAGKSPQAARQTALVRTSGAVTRHVLAGGRDTLILSTAEDTRAGGWARVTAGSPCAFCAVLASRGAVYSANTADFQAHDHCSCSAEAQYEGSRLPVASQRLRDEYDRATSDARAAGDLKRGTSNDLLNAFRRSRTH